MAASMQQYMVYSNDREKCDVHDVYIRTMGCIRKMDFVSLDIVIHYKPFIP